MQKPEKPFNEQDRTQAIQSLGMIYSPSEARFDRITRLVCRHFDISTSLVSIVYKEIQWFKSVQGLNACSTDREVSFCGHAILHDEPLVVENALLDPRFMDNPLVVDGPRIRFYVGQPVKDAFGVAIGTLCLIDGSPRTFSQEDRQDLRDFAALIEVEIAKPVEDNVVTRFIRSLNENQRSFLIDPVVGTWNRRGLEALLTKEMEHAAKHGEKLHLVHVKLTSFETILRRFGHDRIFDFCRFSASIIRDALPNAASIGSLGSDAYVAVCSGMSEGEVKRLLKELKVNYADTTLDTHGVKALVDVEISSMELSGDVLKQTSVQALDMVLSLS